MAEDDEHLKFLRSHFSAPLLFAPSLPSSIIGVVEDIPPALTSWSELQYVTVRGFGFSFGVAVWIGLCKTLFLWNPCLSQHISSQPGICSLPVLPETGGIFLPSSSEFFRPLLHGANVCRVSVPSHCLVLYAFLGSLSLRKEGSH